MKGGERVFFKKIVKQENLKDCGAACLLMMMRKHGGNYPMEQLRTLLKTDKKGTSALNLIEGARQVGFDARGYYCNDLKAIKCPVIAHVIIKKSYHHYLIIDDINYEKEIIKVIDPAFGLKKYTFSEFDQIWSKNIITVIPIRKIDNINLFMSIRQTICNLIKPYLKYFFIILIISIVLTILSIINTYYFKIIVDNNFNSHHFFYLGVFFTIVVFLKTMFTYLKNRLLIFIDKKIDYDLINRTFKHLFSLPFQYFHTRTSGDIIARINDLGYVKEFINKIASIVLIDLVLIIGSIVFMIKINQLLFLITVLILFLYLIVVLIFNKTIKLAIVKNQENNAKVSSLLYETISGIDTIKNLGVEQNMFSKNMKIYQEFLKDNYSFSKKYFLANFFKELITSFGMIVLIYIGGLLMFQKTILAGDLVVFIFFFNFFIDPMKNIFEMEPLLKSSSNAIIRTTDFFQIKEEKNSKFRIKSADIVIKNLEYSYNNLTKTFSDFNLKIKSGEKVLITGKSGTGKSTLMKLIMKQLDIEKGNILISNKNIENYSYQEINNNISYVSQNEILFTDSLYNNIILERETSQEEVKELFKLIEIDHILKRHQIDEHMLLEENGLNLSGGERQRIIMARALLKKSKIVILDESMNEIDNELENKILKNLFSYYRERTFIVITHHFTNKYLFDKVIDLNLKKGVLT